jgi:mRNA-degrading endonuclease YafQ of YafQ-DinJ toxin-antitoxin module
MEKHYIIRTTSDFDKNFRKLAKNNVLLKLQIIEVITLLEVSPFDITLRTHKVHTKKLGEVLSSRVTSDIRILWKFSESQKCIILCLAIGGHDKIY